MSEPDAAVCEHHWIHHAAPNATRAPWVAVCSLCHGIDWAELEAFIEAKVDAARFVAVIDAAQPLESGATYVVTGLRPDVDDLRILGEIHEATGAKFVCFDPSLTIAGRGDVAPDLTRGG